MCVQFLKFYDNRPGHKMSFIRTTKTKSVSNQSCKGGGACFGGACVCAEEGCLPIGSSNTGGET